MKLTQYINWLCGGELPIFLKDKILPFTHHIGVELEFESSVKGYDIPVESFMFNNVKDSSARGQLELNFLSDLDSLANNTYEMFQILHKQGLDFRAAVHLNFDMLVDRELKAPFNKKRKESLSVGNTYLNLAKQHTASCGYPVYSGVDVVVELKLGPSANTPQEFLHNSMIATLVYAQEYKLAKFVSRLDYPARLLAIYSSEKYLELFNIRSPPSIQQLINILRK